MAPQYVEEHGLRVPLFRLKQKRLHVRLASEFASKSKKDLFNLAKDITNGQASKLKDPSRSELALYIERVETLALGPHPKTTLPCKSYFLDRQTCPNDTLATKKEDLIEALGLKTTAPRAKRNKRQQEATRGKKRHRGRKEHLFSKRHHQHLHQRNRLHQHQSKLLTSHRSRTSANMTAQMHQQMLSKRPLRKSGSSQPPASISTMYPAFLSSLPAPLTNRWRQKRQTRRHLSSNPASTVEAASSATILTVRRGVDTR